MTEIKHPIHLKTKPPISLIILALLGCFLIIESIINPIYIFYSNLFSLLFYVHFCRYSCTVLLTDRNISIYYYAPWKKNINISVNDISNINYQRGFYNYFSDKTIGGIFVFPQYCYDRLIIEKKQEDHLVIYVNINTFIYDFRKILNWANQNNLLDKV